MVKLLLISDTHFYRDEYKLCKALNNIDFEVFDYIIHLGDFTSREFYEYLNSTDKLLAVRGNNDFNLPDNIPLSRSITIENFKVSFLHGHTINIQNISYIYPDEDIVIFGHLHDPFYKEILLPEGKEKKQYILSPGSLIHNRYVNYNSYMIIELENGKKPKFDLVKI